MSKNVSSPERQTVVFDVIRNDHAEIREALATAAQATGDEARKIARDALCSKIEHHLQADEHVLYPRLGRVDALDSFMERMAVQHQLIRDAMQSSVDAHLRQEPFAHVLDHLRIQLSEHFDEEERRLFAYAARYLESELDSVAIDMERAHERERAAFGVGVTPFGFL